MAFPQIQVETAQSFGTPGTSHSVSLPAQVSTDNLLLMFFVTAEPDVGRSPGTEINSTPAGWTIGDQDNQDPTGTSFVCGAWLWKKADGTEGGTSVSVGIDNSEEAAAIVAQVWDYDGVSIVQGSSGIASQKTGGSGTGPDWPELDLTSAWGSADNLWICFMAAGNDGVTLSAWPELDNQTQGTANGGTTDQDCTVAICTETATAASRNPGTGTLGSSESFLLHTIAVEPGSSGSQPTSGPTILVPTGPLR